MPIYRYADIKTWNLAAFRSVAVFNQEAPNPIPSSCNQLLVMRVLGAMWGGVSCVFGCSSGGYVSKFDFYKKGYWHLATNHKNLISNN